MTTVTNLPSNAAQLNTTPDQDTELFDNNKFESALTASNARKENPLKLFQDTLKSGGQVLKERFENNVPANELVIGRAYLVDQLLRHAWTSFFNSQGNGIALIAVGGYGRGELHPHSDIDLMILLASMNHDQYKEQIEGFLTFLWDIGLEVGHSVRTVRECVTEGKQDITVATNLMEARLLSGLENIFNNLRKTTNTQHIWPHEKIF